jgi:spermidine synthase
MQTSSSSSPWFWRPGIVVFISNVCVMTLELVAGRIIAPHVGVSLYTWTSVIGVILAGLSLGNYMGGRLADRYASLHLLGGVFLLAGATSLGILGMDQLNLAAKVEWPIIMEIVVLIAALFLAPAVVLGTISPIVVKLAMDDLSHAGRTVGRISAAGTAGSILGTFATGFWLISWFGTHTVVFGVSVVLLAMGLLFFVSGRTVRDLTAIVSVILISFGVVQVGWTTSRCMQETNYFCIKVREEDREGRTVRVLILDRLVHSYNVLDDPGDLVYHYEQTYAELTGYQAARHDPLRTLFIGGGGYTFPRYVDHAFPDSVVDVVEIDPGVTEVAYSHMGVPADARITSYNEDARAFLSRPPDTAYDIIFGDAFDDFSVPYHLTTQSFNEYVRDWLADDGLYVVNIIDGALAQFLSAYVRTLRLTFDHVYVVPRLAEWREISRDTFVVVATDTPLDLTAFDADARLSQSLMTQDAVDALLEEGRPVILTDCYAPVEQMLAPVFLGRTDG